ncbi:MAG: glycosyltransferase [Betaproteobacteria bacterium]|nr:glycosyltransferase [Betaproteobacteria bacterium]
MNIVHVVESLAVGGLERVVLSLATWQRQRGDAIRIVCLFEEGALSGQARAAGIDVRVTGKHSGWDFRALRDLRATLREEPIDVLHTHNAMAHYYAASAALGLGLRRVVNTRHGMGAPRRTRRERLYRLAVLGADAVVFVSHAGYAHFVRRPGGLPERKAHVIANGVEVTAIAERQDALRRTLLTSLGRPPETRLIGAVGRLNPVKDHANLLLAMQRLRQTGHAVDLVLVGDGVTREALAAQARTLQIEDCVHFLGMRDDVLGLLPSFDLFAQPSITEGYSLALVEAAAAALPIVATRVGGNADIVAAGVNGLLVEPRDAAALADALATLLRDRDLRLRMGQAGRVWALNHGSVEAMGRAYGALYGSRTDASGGVK